MPSAGRSMRRTNLPSELQSQRAVASSVAARVRPSGLQMRRRIGQPGVLASIFRERSLLHKTSRMVGNAGEPPIGNPGPDGGAIASPDGGSTDAILPGLSASDGFSSAGGLDGGPA